MPLGAPKTHTFTGLTDGAAVSTGFDQILGTAAVADDLGGGEMVLDFDAIATGVQSQYADTTAGDTVYVQITFDFGFDVVPSGAGEIAQARNSSAKISNVLANVSGGNATVLARGGGDVSLTGWTTATTLALNTRYRLQMAVEVGTSTTGKTKARLIRMTDNTTLAEGEKTDLNNGTTNTNRSNLGKLTSTGTMGLWIDNITVSDTAYAYLASVASSATAVPAYAGAGVVAGDVVAGSAIETTVVAYAGAGSPLGVGVGGTTAAAVTLGVPASAGAGSAPGVPVVPVAPTRIEISFDAGYTGVPSWTDVTSRVRVDPGISLDHWRGDEDSEAQASRLSLVLRNDDGQLTPGKTTSPYYPNVKKGRRIRVVSTRNSVEYTRYYGFIDSWRVDWPGKVSSIAECQVTASSRLSRLGRGVELRSIPEEEYRRDLPAAYYTMGEPTGSLAAYDSSGNTAPPLSMTATGIAATFGIAAGPVTDGLTAAQFATTTSEYSTTISEAVAAWTIEMFYNGTDTPTGPFYGGFAGVIGESDTTLFINDAGTLFSLLLTGTSSITDGNVHHIAMTHDGSSVTLYVDGVAQDSGAASAPSFPESWRFYLSAADAAKTLAHVAVYNTALSPTRIAAHATAGLTGFVNETAAARLTRYAAYAGVSAADTAFETGRSPLTHIDTTGMTALALMRLVEVTEGGVLFDGLSAGIYGSGGYGSGTYGSGVEGALKFHDRTHRYHATSAFTVDYAAGEVANALSPVDDDQQQVNDMTATNTAGVSARVVDQPSKDEHGEYKDSVDLLTTDPDEPLNRASWVVGNHKEPAVRISEVEINLKTASDTLAAGVLAAEPGTMFTLTGLPANAPASSMRLFVEGKSERITADEDRVTLRTSPAEPFDVWILGDSTYGVLGTTTRLAY